MSIGRRRWVVPGGHVPLASTGREPEHTSCDIISILNAGDNEARIEMTVHYADREPVGPYPLVVRARRVRRVRVNDLIDPAALPLGVDYALVIDADRDVVVQFTRQDMGHAARAWMSTIALPVR